jgi:hypothetical protein
MNVIKNFINPRPCTNCKHFIQKHNIDYCSRHKYLVSYELAVINRTFDHLCGKDGSYFELKDSLKNKKN